MSAICWSVASSSWRVDLEALDLERRPGRGCRSRPCRSARRGRRPSAAAASGSGCWLFSPSVSSTMSGRGVRALRDRGRLRAWARASGSCSSRRSGRRRRSRWSAASADPARRATCRAAGSEPVDRGEHLGRVVGRDLDREAAVAEGDDPDPDDRWLVARRTSRAAALAASIRVGARSVAAMLPETSKARMTVPSSRGTLDHALRPRQRDDQDRQPDRACRRRGDPAAAAGARPGGPARPATAGRDAVRRRPDAAAAARSTR